MTDPKQDIESLDKEIHWHCPKLGGEVPFRYCRTLTEGMPCARIIVCWEPFLDVRTFIETHYDLGKLQALWSEPPKDKIVSLLDLIQKAKNQ